MACFCNEFLNLILSCQARISILTIPPQKSLFFLFSLRIACHLPVAGQFSEAVARGRCEHHLLVNLPNLFLNQIGWQFGRSAMTFDVQIFDVGDAMTSASLKYCSTDIGLLNNVGIRSFDVVTLKSRSRK